jgi:hypothetical protein
MTAIEPLKRLGIAVRESTLVFMRDVGHGMLEIGHNSLAAVGLATTALIVFFAGNVELRQDIEIQALGWLQARHASRDQPSSDDLLASMTEPDAVARATAVNPASLNKQQSAVAMWIAQRYKVAPEPIARLVQEAWATGDRAGLEPTLILAVMAIESSFNPFAQSHVGAQGLMQVMTRLHDDKYVPFGGSHAAFDPLTNLRVGALVLKECIARAGGLDAGLKYYVGAANLPDDGGYAGKVLTEQRYLKNVSEGRNVPLNAPPWRAPAPAANAPTVVQAEPPPAVPAAPAAGPASAPSVEQIGRPDDRQPATARLALLAN